MTFKKGNKHGKGRPVGGVSKRPAEAKDVLPRAYTELGGFKGFVDWCKSSDEHLDWFHTRMWIKLLPMNIRVDSTKNIVYKSYHEVSIALADHGISLDSIQKLKQIEFKPPEREDEEVN
jgi:hypothetical protein